MTAPEAVRIPFRVKALIFTFFLNSFAVVGQLTIVGKQVYDLTGNELHLGLLGLAEFVPVALLAPFTGAAADRFDRRLVFGVATAGEVVASMLLFLYARSAPTSVVPIFGIILLSPLAGTGMVREVKEAKGNLKFAASAGLSGLAAATGVIALYFALQRNDVTVVSPIVSTNPIFTLVLAQIFISRMENVTKWLFLGVGITVVGVIVVSVGSTL